MCKITIKLPAKENHDLTFVGYGGHFVFKNIFTKNILTFLHVFFLITLYSLYTTIFCLSFDQNHAFFRLNHSIIYVCNKSYLLLSKSLRSITTKLEKAMKYDTYVYQISQFITVITEIMYIS